MLLQAIRDIIRALPDGGYLSPDNRFQDEFVDMLIHSARAWVIRDQFIKYKRISPQWLQTFIPEYDKVYQDGSNCHVRFTIPQVIALDGRMDGVSFIGNDGKNCTFRQINNRATFAAMTHDPIMNPQSGRKAYALFSGNEVELYGSVLLTSPPRIEAIWAIPPDINTYNVLIDDYPIEESLIREISRVIMQQDMIIITKSYTDMVNQGKDTAAVTKQ